MIVTLWYIFAHAFSILSTFDLVHIRVHIGVSNVSYRVLKIISALQVFELRGCFFLSINPSTKSIAKTLMFQSQIATPL